MSNIDPTFPQQPPVEPQSAYPAPVPPPSGLPNTAVPPPVGYPVAAPNVYQAPPIASNGILTKRESIVKAFPWLAGLGVLVAILGFWFDGFRLTIFAVVYSPIFLIFGTIYLVQAKKAKESLTAWTVGVVLAVIGTVLGIGGQILKAIILSSF